jgi:hypothetical protein
MVGLDEMRFFVIPLRTLSEHGAQIPFCFPPSLCPPYFLVSHRTHKVTEIQAYLCF